MSSLANKADEEDQIQSSRPLCVLVRLISEASERMDMSMVVVAIVAEVASERLPPPQGQSWSG